MVCWNDLMCILAASSIELKFITSQSRLWKNYEIQFHSLYVQFFSSSCEAAKKWRFDSSVTETIPNKYTIVYWLYLSTFSFASVNCHCPATCSVWHEVGSQHGIFTFTSIKYATLELNWIAVFCPSHCYLFFLMMTKWKWKKNIQ